MLGKMFKIEMIYYRYDITVMFRTFRETLWFGKRIENYGKMYKLLQPFEGS